MSAPDPGDPAALPGDAAGAGALAAQRAASSRPASSGPAFARPPPGPAPGPASPTSDAGASVNADNPWLGLASFTEATRGYFYGREQEITELERRVQRKLLTVLFGKSGLGKTSILQAGLVPGLRARGYFPVYLRIDYGHDSPEASEQIKQAINRAAAVRAGERGERGESAGAAGEEAAARGATAEGIAADEGALQAVSGQGEAVPAIDPDESIWEFLHHREVPQDSGTAPGDVSAETRTVKSVATPPAVAAPLQPPSPSPAAPHRPSAPPTPIPLLIFDQFEELFTLAQSDEFGRARAARFVEELADLVENRPPKALEARLDTDDTLAERFDFARSDYRVVISLREDYLAPLESLKKQMPSLSQNRLRLAPMTGAQALEAVLLPGQRLAENSVLLPGQRLGAGAAQVPGRPPGAGRALVSQEVAEAIVRFVAGGAELANAEVEPSLLSLICRELNEQRLAQHHSEISLGLLAGSRESILSSFYERALADQPPAVRSLIEDELLTESGYRENLAEESLLRKLQTAGAAPDALAKLVNRRLLRIEERLDVRRVELTHDVLTGVVKASRDQRHEREARAATERLLAEQAARENAARRALRRARAIAAGCTALAVVAVVAAVVAFFSVQRARSAEQLARQTRAISEQARQEAEGLLGFLTDDFVGELETFGRDQTIAELSQREIDYFQHLPAQLKDPQTVRSGALALLNHAEALTYLGDPVTARKNASEAVALLEQLQRDGDRSDPTTVTLGRAYAQRAALSRGPFQSAQAVVDVRKAADLLRPLAGRAGASDSARRAYLEVLMAELSVERSGGSHETDEEEMRVAQEAQRVGRDLGAPDHGDVTADTHYAQAEALLASDLIELGRNDEGRRAAEEALAQLGQILALRPQYGAALGDQEGAELTLMGLARNELDPAEALRFATQAEQTALVQVRVEPQNLGYTLNLNQAYAFVATSMWDVGRLREALDYERKAMETVGQISAPGPNSALQLALSTMATADLQAQLGDFSGAAATVAAGKALMNPSTLRKLGTAGRATEAFLKVISAITAAHLAYERGNFAAARQIARSAMAALSGQAALDQAGRTVLGHLEARADYALGDFAASAQATRTVLGTAKTIEDSDVVSQRNVATNNMWLAMALARDGKRAEAARTIAPVVAMYRALDKKNHGDPWLPLEFAGALYAQSLTDDAHRAALLREAAQRIDHLLPTIAALHDTREWRTRIEKAQRIASGETARRTERGEAGR